MVGVKTPKTSNYVPVSALGVDSKILDLKLKEVEAKKFNILRFGFLLPT